MHRYNFISVPGNRKHKLTVCPVPPHHHHHHDQRNGPEFVLLSVLNVFLVLSDSGTFLQAPLLYPSWFFSPLLLAFQYPLTCTTYGLRAENGPKAALCYLRNCVSFRGISTFFLSKVSLSPLSSKHLGYKLHRMNIS